MIPGRRIALVIVPLYVVLATALGFVDTRVRAHPDRAYLEYAPAVVSDTEGPPGKYRVLGPFLFDAVRRATGLAPREAWVLFRWLSLFGALLAMHGFLRAWVSHERAVLGTSLAGVLLLLTFTNSWGHPDHFLEFGLCALGAGLIARGQIGWLAPVFVLALLNRETAAFLGVLFFLARPITRAHLWHTAGLATLGVGVLAGLRWWRGWVAYDPWQLTRNLEFLALIPGDLDPYYRAYAWFVALLVVPLVAITLAAWRQQPRFVRAVVAGVVPAYLVVAFCFTSIIETRVFTLLIPWLIPGVLVALGRVDGVHAGGDTDPWAGRDRIPG
jgi:hypothetical protein